MNALETLTYTVGQSSLPERPFLDRLYSEDGAELYLLHDGQDFVLHAAVEGSVSHNRLKHFDEVFLAVILGLIEQGLDHVMATVPLHEPDKINFAKYFGFEEMPSVRVYKDAYGEPSYFREMIYIFPVTLDDQNI
jgi:hypothetical protein